MPEASLLLIFGTSFMVALSGALAPGPLLAIDISESARRGPWVGPLLIAGHGMAELAMVAALAMGMGRLLEREAVGAGIGIAGGLVLTWLGVTLIRGSGGRRFSSGDVAASRSSMNPVGAGIIASVTNPYWLVWWATVGASYMSWSLRLGTPGVASFFSGHILADAAWFSLVSVITAAGGRITKGALFRAVFVGCGIFLVALGAYFFISGTAFFVLQSGV